MLHINGFEFWPHFTWGYCANTPELRATKFQHIQSITTSQ